jgi:hypothetical protein
MTHDQGKTRTDVTRVAILIAQSRAAIIAVILGYYARRSASDSPGPAEVEHVPAYDEVGPMHAPRIKKEQGHPWTLAELMAAV